MLFFHAILTLFLLAVCYLDLTKYIIPNWICGVLLALYPAMLLIMPELPEQFSLIWSVGVCLMVFAVGIAVYALNLAGGGDIKLLAVLSLWTGREATLELVFITALLGGALAFALLLVRPVVAKVTPLSKAEAIPRVFCLGQPLPYGLAITAAFLILLWMGKVPGLPVSW